jgi:hypothetical protein
MNQTNFREGAQLLETIPTGEFAVFSTVIAANGEELNLAVVTKLMPVYAIQTIVLLVHDPVI